MKGIKGNRRHRGEQPLVGQHLQRPAGIQVNCKVSPHLAGIQSPCNVPFSLHS
jgi:hypothetical protein